MDLLIVPDTVCSLPACPWFPVSSALAPHMHIQTFRSFRESRK